jgi:hypothetical protein
VPPVRMCVARRGHRTSSRLDGPPQGRPTTAVVRPPWRRRSRCCELLLCRLMTGPAAPRPAFPASSSPSKPVRPHESPDGNIVMPIGEDVNT